MNKLNINHYVKVKLTDHGIECLRKNYDDLVANGMFPYGFKAPEVDGDGYSRFQMWSLMQDLGPYVRMCGTMPFEIDILIDIQEATNDN